MRTVGRGEVLRRVLGCILLHCNLLAVVPLLGLRAGQSFEYPFVLGKGVLHGVSLWDSLMFGRVLEY